jgi:hypothetical protein
LLFAFGFGLIHGFGFANVLAEMELPPHALGWSLFAFNAESRSGRSASSGSSRHCSRSSAGAAKRQASASSPHWATRSSSRVVSGSSSASSAEDRLRLANQDAAFHHEPHLSQRRDVARAIIAD